MKFLTFIIMIITLESLCLFFFKQTFSMITMLIITVCGFLCFTAKNWKTYNKVIKMGLIGIFCIGIMLIFLKEHLDITPKNTGSVIDELYVFSITFCFILLVMSVFFIKFNANNNSHNILNDDFDYNPATGLPMCGGLDAGGNPYGASDD